METLELPVAEEMDEILSWPEVPPVTFIEQEIDLVAFKLWGEASTLDGPAQIEIEGKK